MLPNPLDRILHRENATVADLNDEELLMYKRANAAINKAPPTITEQINLLDDLIEDLVIKLCDVHTSGDNAFLDANLKARVRNALLMKSALTAPEKAQKYYEKLAKAQEGEL